MYLTDKQYDLLGSLTYRFKNATAEEIEVLRKLQKALGEAKLKKEYGTKTVVEARRIQYRNMASWACNPNSETYLSS